MVVDVLTQLATSANDLGGIAIFVIGLALIGGAALSGIKYVEARLTGQLTKNKA